MSIGCLQLFYGLFGATQKIPSKVDFHMFAVDETSLEKLFRCRNMTAGSPSDDTANGEE